MSIPSALGSPSLKQLVSPKVDFASIIKVTGLGRGELKGPARSFPSAYLALGQAVLEPLLQGEVSPEDGGRPVLGGCGHQRAARTP